ncbi:protein-primed DNA polymerase B [Muninn virus]|nr:protein-primed DNA polymerase B [Muninn virus]
MKTVYGFDTESTSFTEGKPPRLLVICVYGEKEQLVFHRKRDFRKWLNSLENTTILVSFNLPFDFHMAVGDLKEVVGDKKLNIESQPFFVSVKRKNSKKKPIVIKFIGLENFTGKAHKLSKLAQIYNVTSKIEYDVKNVKKYSEDLKNYCMNDAKIVYEIYTKYFFKPDFKHIPLSATSIFYRELKASASEKINCNRTEFVKKIERKAYFGGRNEAFYLSYDNIKQYDVNSLYPSIMAYSKLPYAFKEYKIKTNITELISVYESDSLEGIVYAKVLAYQPCLPLKLKDTLIFPIGVFEGYYYICELMHYYKKGWLDILETGDLILYNAKPGLFKEYVEETYNERRKHPKGSFLNEFLKIKLNAGYGKFAERKRIIFKLKDKAVEGERRLVKVDGEYKLGMVKNLYGELYLEFKTDREKENRFTALAGCVTALGRVKIADLIEQAGVCVYVDTDSVFTPNTLPVDENLGGLKLEYQGDFRFHALKFYKIGDRVKQKGVPYNSILLKEDGDSVEYEYTQLVKYRSAIRRKIPAYSYIKTVKKISNYRNYVKGYVNDSVIQPLIVLNNKILCLPCLNQDKLKEHYKDLMLGYTDIISLASDDLKPYLINIGIIFSSLTSLPSLSTRDMTSLKNLIFFSGLSSIVSALSLAKSSV